MPKLPVSAAALAVALISTAACTPRQAPSAPETRRAPTTPSAVPARAPEGSLHVRGTSPSVHADFLSDHLLHLSSRPAPVQLRSAPHPALQGTLAPLVVESGGGVLAFSAYEPAIPLDPDRPPSEQGLFAGDPLGTPRLVVHDLGTGAEQVLAEGAYAPAWRQDGAIAYVQGSDAVMRANTPYLGQIHVRPSVDAEAEEWTLGEGRYVVAGWVGSSLLYYHAADNESFDLEVAHGPGHITTLAPAATLVAVSPDGRQVAVATSANGGSSQVRLVDLATGNTVAWSDTPPLTSVVYRGSWVGSRLVARGGDATGAVLHVFDASGGRLRLQKVLRVDPQLPVGLAEPHLDSHDPDRLTAWSYVPGEGRSGHYVLVACDLRTASCVTGPPIRAKVVRLFSGDGR